MVERLQMQLVFHNDDHSSHTLTVDSLTTVAQVCDQLVQSNHAVHSPHWTVVERLARNQLGQLLSLLLYTRVYCCSGSQRLY